MTAFRKLFIAAALMGTGLGVAVLLGEPAALQQALNSATPNLGHLVGAAPVEPAIGAWPASSVRLVPDAAAADSAITTPNALQAPLLEPHLAPIAATIGEHATEITPPRATAVAESNRFGPWFNGAPRASLRHEAPRPIGNEPRSPATIRRTPPVESEHLAFSHNDDVYNVNADGQAPQLLPTSFASDGGATSATNAAYDVPAKVADNDRLAAPPWPATEEREEPRIHVVVDGDSLEKLAGRYLGDPQRSAEIFELNRGLLSNPDLLPIGAELQMPDRALRTSWDWQSRRASFPNGSSVREAASGNLVPVRAMSSGEDIIPRAQLARPVPFE